MVGSRELSVPDVHFLSLLIVNSAVSRSSPMMGQNIESIPASLFYSTINEN
jgi:hypothetical protein